MHLICDLVRNHAAIVKLVHEVMYMLGGMESIQTCDLSAVQTIPLTQRSSCFYCAFHVIARVWLLATGQPLCAKLDESDIAAVRKYCQYLIASKNESVCGVPIPVVSDP